MGKADVCRTSMGRARVPQAAPHAPRSRPTPAPHHAQVAILELGCGGNVTTVRMQTESTLEELCSAGVDAALIRVNPELPLVDDTSLEGRVLPLLSGGLDAVREQHAQANGLQPPAPTAHGVCARKAADRLCVCRRCARIRRFAASTLPWV